MSDEKKPWEIRQDFPMLTSDAPSLTPTTAPAREFHCIPQQGPNDTGFCVTKSDHGVIKGLAIHVIEYSAYESACKERDEYKWKYEELCK